MHLIALKEDVSRLACGLLRDRSDNGRANGETTTRTDLRWKMRACKSAVGRDVRRRSR